MKKKYIIIAVISVLLAVGIFAATQFNIFSFLSSKTDKAVTVRNNTVQSYIVTEPETEDEEEKEEEKPTHTLMIYMVGSDLESRSGAGTDDLKEIEKSGIDTKKVNVIVYAGGSKKWHNDIVSSENLNMLKLTDKGFVKVESRAVESMGTSQCLSGFLNYAYENFPAENFGLIFWNHGSGPLMGYGKDMLYNADSLTLAEMEIALQNSPFNSSNKLSWVGFDACLMSSAELVCTWGNYANFLVASQEIEPAIGWNYTVFGNYDKTNTPSFIVWLINSYYNTCQKYYEEKEMKNRDTTLACINLAYAGQLEAAIETLFSKATLDMPVKYNTLVQKRVATRALGRASTNSEYDLIDLNDLMVQLESEYPEETGNIKNIISKMMVFNKNNTENCCGISLYYPFYNKKLFTRSPDQINSYLSVFKNYGEYLNKYQDIWLNDDQLDQYEKSPIPEKVISETSRNDTIEGTYKLELSPKQQETFASSKFYILRQVNGEMYNYVYVSGDVECKDGVIYADYDGNVIYVKDNYSKRFIPPISDMGSDDKFSYYSIVSYANFYTSNMKPLEFHFSLNRENGDLSTMALVSANTSANPQGLNEGKYEEYKLEDFQSYHFLYKGYKYLTRYENGLVRPISEWLDTGATGGYVFPIHDGLKFSYEPIEADDYYLMFEITDTRGSKYCSELLLLEGKDYSSEKNITLPEINLQWNDEEKLEILSRENVTVYLKKSTQTYTGKPVYRLEVENNNDFKIGVHIDDITINGENTKFYFMSSYVDPKSTDDSGTFPDESDIILTGTDEIHSLKGIISITETESYSHLVYDNKLNIDMNGNSRLENLTEHYGKLEFTGPFYGAFAEEQILYDGDDAIVTLLGYGKNIQSGYKSVMCLENKTDKIITIDIDAESVNSITLRRYNENILKPKTKKYISLNTTGYKDFNISQIETLSYHLSIYDGYAESFFDTPYMNKWIEVQLKEKSRADSSTQQGKEIYSDDSIRIYLKKHRFEYGSLYWDILVENNLNEDIYLSFTDSNSGIYGSCYIGAKQCTHADLHFLSDDNDYVFDENFKINANFKVFDYYRRNFKFTNERPIILTCEEVIPEPINVLWEKEDSVKLYDQNGILLSIAKEKAEYKEGLLLFYDGTYYYNGELIDDFSKIKYIEYDTYNVIIENNSPNPINVKFDSPVLNGYIQTNQKNYSLISYSIEPGEKRKINNIIEPTTEVTLGVFKETESIEGCFTIEKVVENSNYSIVENQKYKIELSGDAVLKGSDMCPKVKKLTNKPYKDALANEQALWETEDFKISLIYFGENKREYYDWDYKNNTILKFENRSDEEITFELRNVCCNNMISPEYFSTVVLAPGDTKYSTNSFEIQEESIETMAFLFSVEYSKRLGAQEHFKWVDVNLKQKGKAQNLPQKNNIIYDNENILINLNDIYSEDGKLVYDITVFNNREQTISLSTYDGNISIYENHLGPGQHQKLHLTVKNNTIVEDVRFKLRCRDSFTDEIIFEDYQYTILNYPGDEQASPSE